MSTTIFELKTYSEEAYQAVCRFTLQLSPGREAPSEKLFRAILSSEHSHLLFIKDDQGVTAGMLTVGMYASPTGCKAWIEDVVVDNTYRGHGYGKELVAYAIGFIRGLGAEVVSLTSNPSRIVANQLYQALGFERYETNVYKMRLES